MKTKTFCRFVQVLQGGAAGGRHDLIRFRRFTPQKKFLSFN